MHGLQLLRAHARWVEGDDSAEEEVCRSSRLGNDELPHSAHMVVRQGQHKFAGGGKSAGGDTPGAPAKSLPSRMCVHVKVAAVKNLPRAGGVGLWTCYCIVACGRKEFVTPFCHASGWGRDGKIHEWGKSTWISVPLFDRSQLVTLRLISRDQGAEPREIGRASISPTTMAGVDRSEQDRDGVVGQETLHHTDRWLALLGPNRRILFGRDGVSACSLHVVCRLEKGEADTPHPPPPVSESATWSEASLLRSRGEALMQCAALRLQAAVRCLGVRLASVLAPSNTKRDGDATVDSGGLEEAPVESVSLQQDDETGDAGRSRMYIQHQVILVACKDTIRDLHAATLSDAGMADYLDVGAQDLGAAEGPAMCVEGGVNMLVELLAPAASEKTGPYLEHAGGEQNAQVDKSSCSDAPQTGHASCARAMSSMPSEDLVLGGGDCAGTSASERAGGSCDGACAADNGAPGATPASAGRAVVSAEDGLLVRQEEDEEEEEEEETRATGSVDGGMPGCTRMSLFAKQAPAPVMVGFAAQGIGQDMAAIKTTRDEVGWTTKAEGCSATGPMQVVEIHGRPRVGSRRGEHRAAAATASCGGSRRGFTAADVGTCSSLPLSGSFEIFPAVQVLAGNFRPFQRGPGQSDTSSATQTGIGGHEAFECAAAATKQPVPTPPPGLRPAWSHLRSGGIAHHRVADCHGSGADARSVSSWQPGSPDKMSAAASPQKEAVQVEGGGQARPDAAQGGDCVEQMAIGSARPRKLAWEETLRGADENAGFVNGEGWGEVRGDWGCVLRPLEYREVNYVGVSASTGRPLVRTRVLVRQEGMDADALKRGGC